MKKLFLLAQPDVLSLYNINKMLHGKKEERGKNALRLIGIVALVLYCVGVYIFGIATMLQQGDAMEYFPALMVCVSMIFPLITTMFRVENVLFRYRNQDMMQAMPIPKRTLVASRILVLTIFDSLFSYMIVIPSVVVYAMIASPGVGSILSFVIIAIAAPLLPVSISALVGCLLLRVTSKFAKNKFINIIVSFVFLVLVMGISYGSSFAAMQNGGLDILVYLKKIIAVFPISLVFNAISTGNFLYCAAFAAMSVLSFAICALVISTFYDKISAMLSPATKRKRTASDGPQPQLSQRRTLLKQEVKRYFTLPIYVINTAFGSVLMVVATVALVVITPAKLLDMMGMPGVEEYVAPALIGIMALMVLIDSTTACAISLEGASLSVLRALPIKPRAYLESKIGLNLLVSLPAALVCSLALAIVLRPGALNTVLLFVTPVVCAFTSAVMGLFFNIKFPRLQWQNVTVVVKQSMSVFCTIMVNILIGLLLFSVAFNGWLLLALNSVLLAAMWLLNHYNTTRGFPKMLQKLDR